MLKEYDFPPKTKAKVETMNKSVQVSIHTLHRVSVLLLYIISIQYFQL